MRFCKDYLNTTHSILLHLEVIYCLKCTIIHPKSAVQYSLMLSALRTLRSVHSALNVLHLKYYSGAYVPFFSKSKYRNFVPDKAHFVLAGINTVFGVRPISIHFLPLPFILLVYWRHSAGHLQYFIM